MWLQNTPIWTRLQKTSIERGPNSEDGITKAGRFSWVTTKKLGSSKEVNGK